MWAILYLVEIFYVVRNSPTGNNLVEAKILEQHVCLKAHLKVYFVSHGYTLRNVTPSLVSETLSNGVFSSNLPPCFHIFLSYITYFDIKIIHLIKEFKPHAHTHHVVIIVIIVIIAMLTLCYSVMSHVALILYYHVSMLTKTTCLLNITCTLVATGVILGGIECTMKVMVSSHKGCRICYVKSTDIFRASICY